jgi:hypothetical protein
MLNLLLRVRLLRLLTALAAALVLLPGCGDKPAPAVESFLERHWADPLPAQGTPPASFSALEASLNPEACGQCHVEQYAGWRTSLHSRAMGPGLRWQLMLMSQEQGNRCLRCHAPLAEQKALLALEHGWPNAPKQPPPDFVPVDLGHGGLVCATCHVRGHQRFGPPPRGEVAEGGPHGGFTVAKAFEDSRFCAHCHQFPDDGPRIAGKLQEDTYAQWLASDYAKEGPGKKGCQSCHMPDRQHLWRGIHDPEMTRRAIDVTLKLAPLGGGRHEAVASVRNSGAGHHFPTYMVPKVELVFYRRDAGGGRLELGRQIIGWQIDTPITREIADTRIPAGETREFRQPFVAPDGGGWNVELVMRVLPGEHYERIYRDSLGRAGQLPPAAVPLLRQALADAEVARYELLRVEAGAEDRDAPIAN